MKTKIKESLGLSFISLLTAMSVSSCSETEIVAFPEGEPQPGKEITLNISAPADASTRATSDHKLRFTAKLFKGKYGSDPKDNFIEKKQAIASEGKGTIVFSVPQGDYSVLLFADYIPNSTQADSEGLYEDAYYDTSSKDEEIRMIAFTTNTSSHDLIQKHCINNDNYDCFSAYTGVINKTESVYEENFVLERAVSKVRVVSNTPPPSPVTEIKFTRFYCFDIFKQYYNTVFCEKTYENMRLSSHTISGMSNPDINEIFYFYTLAANNTENLGEISCDIKFQDGETKTLTIPTGTIKVKRKYITTVKGNILSEPIPETGDIILHLTSDDTWLEQEFKI